MHGIGRLQPGKRIAGGVLVPARVRAEPRRQTVGRVQAPGSAVLVELDEDGVLEQSAEAREIGVESRRYGRLAVADRERGELPQNDLVGHAEGRDGADGADPRDDRAAACPEPGEDVVHLAGVRDLRRLYGMHPAAFRCRFGHPHVVDVGLQDRESHHEPLAVAGPRGQETPVRDARELEDAGRDVPSMDDAVVGEERGVLVGRRRQRWVGPDSLQPRDLLDGLPEPVFEDLANVGGEVVVDRHRCWVLRHFGAVYEARGRNRKRLAERVLTDGIARLVARLLVGYVPRR